MDYIKNPMEIENTSMKIIESEMGEHNFTKEELSIIKRTIHTTAAIERVIPFSFASLCTSSKFT